MYLLDTNTIIDFCNAKLPEKSANLLHDVSPIISVITQIELFSSMQLSIAEKDNLIKLVKIAKVIDHLDEDIVNHTIKIRQNYRTKLPDAIIAATAIVNNLTLITRNISDFYNIEGLKLINSHSI